MLRIRIRIRFHKSDIWIRIRIPLSSIKNSKKNIDSYCFVTYYVFLSLKNDVTAPSKSNKQKNVKNFFLRIEDHCWKQQEQDPHPDPESGSISQRSECADPDPHLRIRIRIRNKIAWIRNTAGTFLFPRFWNGSFTVLRGPGPEPYPGLSLLGYFNRCLNDIGEKVTPSHSYGHHMRTHVTKTDWKTLVSLTCSVFEHLKPWAKTQLHISSVRVCPQ